MAESTAMGFLRRIFGVGGSGSGGSATSAPADPVDIDAAERAYDLELASTSCGAARDLCRSTTRPGKPLVARPISAPSSFPWWASRRSSASRSQRAPGGVRPSVQAERPNVEERRRRLNERLRAEFLAGAEEEWRKRAGRQMTAESSIVCLGGTRETYRRLRHGRLSARLHDGFMVSDLQKIDSPRGNPGSLWLEAAVSATCSGGCDLTPSAATPVAATHSEGPAGPPRCRTRRRARPQQSRAVRRSGVHGHWPGRYRGRVRRVGATSPAR